MISYFLFMNYQYYENYNYIVQGSFFPKNISCIGPVNSKLGEMILCIPTSPVPGDKPLTKYDYNLKKSTLTIEVIFFMYMIETRQKKPWLAISDNFKPISFLLYLSLVSHLRCQYIKMPINKYKKIMISIIIQGWCLNA